MRCAGAGLGMGLEAKFAVLCSPHDAKSHGRQESLPEETEETLQEGLVAASKVPNVQKMISPRVTRSSLGPKRLYVIGARHA